MGRGVVGEGESKGVMMFNLGEIAAHVKFSKNSLSRCNAQLLSLNVDLIKLDSCTQEAYGMPLVYQLSVYLYLTLEAQHSKSTCTRMPCERLSEMTSQGNRNFEIEEIKTLAEFNKRVLVVMAVFT